MLRILQASSPRSHWRNSVVIPMLYVSRRTLRDMKRLPRSSKSSATCIMCTLVLMVPFAHRTDAAWGLARISQTAKVSGSADSLTYSYSYDSTAGKGVDIYIVDAGIYTEHVSHGICCVIFSALRSCNRKILEDGQHWARILQAALYVKYILCAAFISK